MNTDYYLYLSLRYCSLNYERRCSATPLRLAMALEYYVHVGSFYAYPKKLPLHLTQTRIKVNPSLPESAPRHRALWL